MMGAVMLRTEQTTLEGSSCTSIMTYTGGSGYSFLVLLMMGAVMLRTEQTTLEGSSCASIMTYTRGSG